MKKLTEQMEWQALSAHQKKIAAQRMQDWFDLDPERFTRFSLKQGDILLDYSKNRITSETINLLNNLAKISDLPQKIEDLFTGQPLNASEKRAALHTALRNPQTESVFVHQKNIMPDIKNALEKMRHFSDQVRDRHWLGATGKPIRDIVNIGIGGSYLGPLMCIHALGDFSTKDIRCHFISNIDAAHIRDVLDQIQPETTLFIISSKSFTTLETITNANTIRHWLIDHLGANNIQQHMVAVTAATEQALQFGIPNDSIFPLWDWVGGRYSIWSSIGLPLAILIGMDRFLEFLQGAYEMDQHFRYAPFCENMPVMMGLLGIWYINFFNAVHHAVIPYSHHLNYFRVHLQQLDMESNGKHISEQGHEVDVQTSPVIFGEQGCNGQHSFHQLLHQGKHFIPVDFILVGKENDYELNHHQNILVGSGLSQAAALMRGKSYDESFDELLAKGLSKEECDFLAKHKTIPGNRPSNILFINKINPRNLGSLLALYEHKTFVQAAIWRINSFDQWGVELGKNLLPAILSHLNSDSTHAENTQDSSTQGLIHHYKNMRGNS